jgi:hypothetical protein
VRLLVLGMGRGILTIYFNLFLLANCLFSVQIYIRRLSGDVSWMCRIQNSSLVSDSHGEFPLADLTALFQPTKDSDVREQMAAALDPSKRVSIENLMTQQMMEDMAVEVR